MSSERRGKPHLARSSGRGVTTPRCRMIIPRTTDNCACSRTPLHLLVRSQVPQRPRHHQHAVEPLLDGHVRREESKTYHHLGA
eukprot:15474021-Alexandrium_andersonii.AAC.1